MAFKKKKSHKNMMLIHWKIRHMGNVIYIKEYSQGTFFKFSASINALNLLG